MRDCILLQRLGALELFEQRDNVFRDALDEQIGGCLSTNAVRLLEALTATGGP